MFKKFLSSVGVLAVLGFFLAPISVGAVAGDYDYSLIFSADQNVKSGKILTGSSAIITATLVNNAGSSIAADSATSWKMRNKTSVGTVSNFTVASGLRSASIKYQAPNDLNAQAIIEAVTVKDGRTFSNTFAVTTTNALMTSGTASDISVGAIEPIQIPDFVGTGGSTGGFWNSLVAGFSQMSATTWAVVVIILICLVVIFSLAKKEATPRKK